MKSKFNLLFFIIILNCTEKTFSQEVSNVQSYTPSVLLDIKQVDIQFFNNVYSQTGYRDVKGQFVESGRRETYYSGLIQGLYGLDKNRRINVGFDLNIKSVLLDTNYLSPFNVLKFENHQTARSEILTSLGPKIKFLPFKKSRISIQSALWIPVQQNLEGNPWLDYQRFTSWTQFFYDKTYNGKYQLFLEGDILARIGTDFDVNTFETRIPISVFGSYFPTSKSTVYLMAQAVPTVSNLPNYYAQVGAGVKYQLFNSLNLELLYSNFVAGINNGAGQTYNVGLRYIH